MARAHQKGRHSTSSPFPPAFIIALISRNTPAAPKSRSEDDEMPTRIIQEDLSKKEARQRVKTVERYYTVSGLDDTSLLSSPSRKD